MKTPAPSTWKEALGCPHCGGVNLEFFGLMQPFVVICRECNCVGPEGTTIDEAFAGWNRRAAPPIAYVDVEVEAS